MVFPKKRQSRVLGSQSRCREKKTDWLPEEKCVYIRTFGCAHNASDSEYMAGVLASEGYEVTTDASDAARSDAWVINSCTVKDPSQAAFMRVAADGIKAGKAVVVAGCVPQAQRGIMTMPALVGASVIGIKQIARVGEAVSASLRGETFSALGTSGDLPELELPKIRRDELVEIVPLSTGCLGACTYCKTRHARGKLGSYSPEAIERRVVGALEDGVAEIWLSSEDVGAYGIDLGTSLGALLRRLVKLLADYPATMVRVGMSNPPFLLSQLDDLADVLESPNVFAFVHIPVQSGSDAVLSKRRMNREYSVADFKRVVAGLESKMGSGPTKLTVCTDIICGFPGESDADFDDTLRLVCDCRLTTVNISQFYARPGTPAAIMRPRVPTDVVKARSRTLTKYLAACRPYDDLVGQTLSCSARDELADGGERLVAHTKTYVKVLIPFDVFLVGAHFDAVVTAAHRWHVEARVVRVIIPADPSRRPALRAALSRLTRKSSIAAAQLANEKKICHAAQPVRHVAVFLCVCAAVVLWLKAFTSCGGMLFYCFPLQA